jgi:dTDP-4-dehydrorhamnose 3,5-epimerase
MGTINLDTIKLTRLKRVQVIGGDVLHVMKSFDNGFEGFGEAYISLINPGVIKAWKLHKQMTLNLIVPSGEVRFVFISADFKQRREEIIGISNYSRLTVPPGIWFGFQGLGTTVNTVLNIANITHDPNEVERIGLEEFKYKF